MTAATRAHSLLPAALAVAVSMAVPLAVHAEDGISTDRPDFVESSSVVGKGRFQLETGFGVERNKADGVKDRFTSTPTLLRFGLGDTWELRLETDGYSRLRSEDRNTGVTTRERGANDVALGIKWHTSDGDQATHQPSTAWLFHADLDTGSAPFRGDGVRPSVRFVAEWDLPNDWSVGVMPGVFVEKNADGDRYTGGIAAITFGKGWTDQFGTYFEIAGQQLASKKNGGNVVTYDMGATYALTQDLQVDAGFSWGLNRNTPDFAWGVGVSVRF
ncbi:MAG: transporter [Rubrivivax sp.]|nr:MAG: transporter [Rubrivivax sp.]